MTLGAAEFRTLTVQLGERSYPVVIGPGARTYLASHQPLSDRSRRVVVLADQTVARHWLATLTPQLPADAIVIEMPPGESSKSLANAESICGQLAAARVDRSGLLIAFGGGVIGDLGGFVASIWNRGIPFIQIPTTLLAAVDASVGGKTGVNLTAGKNLVGAFHQPQLVVVDTEFLSTLPDREYAAGLAESVKHAAIREPALLDWHESHARAIAARADDVLIELIAGNCAIKADVVAQDEREAGLRAILNHGHTVGHAIEALFEYELLHGECVALGMLVENEIAVARGRFERGSADRVRTLIEKLGLPARLPHRADSNAVWRYCLIDKKNQAGRVHCVLLEGFGRPVRIGDIAQADVAAALAVIQP